MLKTNNEDDGTASPGARISSMLLIQFGRNQTKLHAVQLNAYLIVLLPGTWTPVIRNFTCEKCILAGIHFCVLWLLGKSLECIWFCKERKMNPIRIVLFWISIRKLLEIMFNSKERLRPTKSYSPNSIWSSKAASWLVEGEKFDLKLTKLCYEAN